MIEITSANTLNINAVSAILLNLRAYQYLNTLIDNNINTNPYSSISIINAAPYLLSPEYVPDSKTESQYTHTYDERR